MRQRHVFLACFAASAQAQSSSVTSGEAMAAFKAVRAYALKDGSDVSMTVVDRDGQIVLMLRGNTAAPHNLDPFLKLLAINGTMCMIGVPSSPHPSPNVFNLIFGRHSLAGSLIGGIKETQEMLDFCADHGIVSDIETIPMQDIEKAYARMLKNDVKYRFVIDMASLKA